MKEYGFNARKVGIVLIVISIALILIFLSSTNAIMESENLQCTKVCGIDMNKSAENCPHENDLPFQSYAGFSVALVLAGLGVFMVLNVNPDVKKDDTFKPLDETIQKLEKVAGTLAGDEKKIFELVKDSQGAILQSDLIDKTGYTKVKVSRILDKLEGRGTIERRRRGMTNLVIVRRDFEGF